VTALSHCALFLSDYRAMSYDHIWRRSMGFQKDRWHDLGIYGRTTVTTFAILPLFSPGFLMAVSAPSWSYLFFFSAIPLCGRMSHHMKTVSVLLFTSFLLWEALWRERRVVIKGALFTATELPPSMFFSAQRSSLYIA
jgi:hypothetical protein